MVYRKLNTDVRAAGRGGSDAEGEEIEAINDAIDGAESGDEVQHTLKQFTISKRTQTSS